MQAESKNQRWQPVVIALLLGATLMRPGAGLAADNLTLSGALVAAACKIKAGDEVLAVDLGAVTNADLYLYTRTVGKTFQIHLEDCNTGISNSVTTTFSGTENTKLPGLLALGGTIEKGVAIGLETLGGTPLPLNVASARQALSNGANVIAFKVFIKGEPQAVANRLIKPGYYTAVSTFTLDYP
ncbi:MULTISPECIES: fimbrial protein [Pseudomonas]|uniref:Fimbrial protein n=1 Tax=Pseudomonas kulmbachensis TaxID=3043408 RepID=A0ABW7M5Q8_9PSED